MSASSHVLSDALSLKATGNDHLASKGFSQAIAAYTQAVDLLHRNPECDVQRPALRAVLLSNRSHAHLLSKCPDKALEDADCCIEIEPEWPKAHLRRANALRNTCLRSQQQAALGAYEDAIAAARVEDNAPLVSELKELRKQCERELRRTGPARLAKEVSDLGCLLAVPEDAHIAECRCLGAALEPAAYDGVDDRTNTPIHAVCPGDSCWPIFAPILHRNNERIQPHFPLHYYLLGSCFLTSACVEEIDEIFKTDGRHACRWPDGRATRICPICATACAPDKNDTFTMVVHMLMGKAAGGNMAGIRMMMQLVCKRCTRKRILKATCPSTENFRDNIHPLQRLRMLSDGIHATKASLLWNRASNTGLLSSITLHAQEIFQYRHIISHNTGAKTTPVASSGGAFFETWIARPHEREIGGRQEHLSGGGAPVAERDRVCHTQEFHIRQVATIKSRRTAIGRFWKKFGGEFRRKWHGWDPERRMAFAGGFAKTWFDARMNHFNRRDTQYSKVEDPRRLMNKPFGKVPKTALSFLPEVAGSAFGDARYDLVELFQGRASSTKTWIAEDASLVAQLRKQNRLPKLFHNETDGSYLCDYMGIKDSTIGPFVVLVGERDSEYDAVGHVDGHPLSAEAVVKMSDYQSLRAPFLENITIISAGAPGEVRVSLESLLDGRVATDAVCYIYAAMRQEMLLAYLQGAAECFYGKYIGDDYHPSEITSWSYAGRSGCYVCGARKRPDGSKLLVCSKCQLVNYCSKKCQKLDWKRHKAESCIGASV